MTQTATAILLSLLALAPTMATATSTCVNSAGAIATCSQDSGAVGLFVDGEEFRTYDGFGNNQSRVTWGSTGTQFLRGADAAYSDGVGALARQDAASAREISQTLGETGGDYVANEAGLSNMFWAWGQFVDHDITLSRDSEAAGQMNLSGGGDSVFGSSAMGVSRSEYTTDASGARQQINSITAFLDASNVYGSDEATSLALRTLDGTGRMKLDENGFLPRDSDGNFQAGDIRANEQQQLITMHTVFAREHNRVADTLADANPEWSGERIYQEARAVVGAEIQAVTYNEWLPKLLGDAAPGAYMGYDANVNPSLTNEFSACAFRFCHSMIPDELARLEENGDPIADGNLRLRDGFFNPHEFVSAGGVDPLVRGLAATSAMEVDRMLSDELRNFLNLNSDEDSDLLARNIARGRDHGLADYNTLRAAYGLEPITSWEQLTDDPVLLAELRAAYGDDINAIDPFVGSMFEEHVNGGIVGALNAAIIGDQFNRLRTGDRFWYENIFSADMVSWINNRSLSDILRDNTGVDWLQDDVFVAAARTGAVSAPGMLLIGFIAMGAMRRRRKNAA